MPQRFVLLKPRIGARVEVPRDEILDPKFADECLEALERHGVLVFPGIDLSDEEQVTLSEHLGEVIPLGPERPDGTREPLFKVSVDPRENPRSAEYLKATIGWHIDGLQDDGPPPRATLLCAKRLSAVGGQTEFCSTYAAYEDLPPAERERCAALRVVHSLLATKRATDPDVTGEELERWRAHDRRKEHPLVWQHASGRRSLVLGVTVDHVVGMPEAGGSALIDRLTAHAARPENVYRHEWQVGDAVIWDNCGVMHRVVAYDLDSGRLMHRTTLHGTEHIAAIELSG